MSQLLYLFWLECFRLALWLEAHAIHFRDYAQRRKMELVVDIPGDKRAW